MDAAMRPWLVAAAMALSTCVAPAAAEDTPLEEI
jgi:hypothetical protein